MSMSIFGVDDTLLKVKVRMAKTYRRDLHEDNKDENKCYISRYKYGPPPSAR